MTFPANVSLAASSQVPVSAAAEVLREGIASLTGVLRAERAQLGRVRLDAEMVGADLALWLDALTGPAAPENLPRLQDGFHGRHRVYAEKGLSSVDFLVLHHDCAGYLSRCLTDQLASMLPHTSRYLVHSAVSAAVALPLQAAVVSVTGACPGPQGGPGHAPATEAPRWCLVALLASGDGAALVERFRRANQGATITTGEARLTVLTAAPPVVPAQARPYGLAPTTGADIPSAVRRATAAARLARYYGLGHLDARHLPLALSRIGTTRSRGGSDECLGPLCDTRRHGHLLETLRAYLTHNLCVASAARSMYIHRQTFTYRLRRIRELTGLDMTHPFDRLRAELALLEREMTETAPPRGRGPAV
ncbi:PucR family transcriptional regulator [Streptomyces sp. G5(2025)]|uniref:PucR family transcriptional regulator n=1 Tax=Streptomyces sp. G5(2025) TaxID=3406628 RepID=UPI003C221E73